MRRVALASMVAGFLFTPQAMAQPAAPSEPVRSRIEDFRIDPSRDRIGRIYNYVRSNQDDSVAERVSVFRKSRTGLEVYKARGRCEPAALVSADLDLSLMSPVRITGGRLLPEGRVHEFAFLEVNRAARRIDFRVDLPDQTLEFTSAFERYPWHLYDFDLASLTVLTPYLKAPEQGFDWDMILALADPTRTDPVSYLGGFEAMFDGYEMRDEREALRFRVTGPALQGTAGQVWLDSREGHIVEARFALPNHVEYRDFKLLLTSIDDGGADTWRTILVAHHIGCGT